MVDRECVDAIQYAFLGAAGIFDIPSPKYLVLGTLDRRVYRRGLLGGASLDDVKEHMADFKSYWKVPASRSERVPRICEPSITTRW